MHGPRRVVAFILGHYHASAHLLAETSNSLSNTVFHRDICHFGPPALDDDEPAILPLRCRCVKRIGLAKPGTSSTSASGLAPQRVHPLRAAVASREYHLAGAFEIAAIAASRRRGRCDAASVAAAAEVAADRPRRVANVIDDLGARSTATEDAFHRPDHSDRTGSVASPVEDRC